MKELLTMGTFTSETLQRELLQNVLPYWMTKMIDQKNGGFYGRRNGVDHLVEDAPKGVILNTRILWTFSAAARMYNDQRYVDIANRAFQYLMLHFSDRVHGGVFWTVDHLGHSLETKKQIYAQAFAIYAYTEYYLLTGLERALEEAKQLYKLIEIHSFDKEHNGYFEAFDRSWNLLDDLRLSEKDANEKKTMNTHLHVLEAYTNLYRCWKDDDLKKQLRNLIMIFLQKIKNEQNHYDLFFDEQWRVKSHEISFGHDIEGSWLLCEAAEVLGDHALLQDVQAVAVNMVDLTLAEGLDDDGGLMNEAGPDGLTDTDKHWWPQAEALVGLVNAWQITKNRAYVQHAQRIWSFIDAKIIDHTQGEWYWRVNRDGDVNLEEDKAGPWKCPYHNGRALMEVLSRLNGTL